MGWVREREGGEVVYFPVLGGQQTLLGRDIAVGYVCGAVIHESTQIYITVINNSYDQEFTKFCWTNDRFNTETIPEKPDKNLFSQALHA